MFAGLVVALAIWCAVDVARRAIVDPGNPSLHMTDFTVYTEAGRAFFDGREPYDVSNIRGWKYLYPPLFALLVAPLSLLAPPWQASVWFALSALLAFGCYFECRRLLLLLVAGEPRDERSIQTSLPGEKGGQAPRRSLFSARILPCGEASPRLSTASSARTGSIPPWVPLAAGVAALFPALNCLQRGQMGLALLYPLLLGFRWAAWGRSPAVCALGGTLLALPIALKLTPALPAGCLLAALILECEWGRRSLRQAARRPLAAGAGLLAGLALFFLLIPAALIGWQANLRHLTTWHARVGSRVDDVRADDFGGDVASFRNQSLHNAVYRCGNWVAHTFFAGPDDISMDVTRAAMPMDAPLVSTLLRGTRSLALVVLGLAVVAAGWRRDRLLLGTVFGLACVATLVVSPVARGHYYVFWIPAALLAPLWLSRKGRTGAALASALIPAALTVTHYVALDYAGRAGLLGIGTAVWYFAQCGMVLADRSPDQGTPAAVATPEAPPVPRHAQAA